METVLNPFQGYIAHTSRLLTAVSKCVINMGAMNMCVYTYTLHR